MVSSIVKARLPRFLLVGCAGLVCDAAAFSTLSSLSAPDFVARALSLAAATLLTWQLNRRFTFAASGHRAHAEAWRYASVAMGVQGFNYALFLILRSVAPSAPSLGALLVSAGAAAGLSFASQSIVTFGAQLWPAGKAAPLGPRI